MNPTSALSRPILLGVARKGAVIVLGVALITLCAKIRVPSWPVPMTLHTLAVMAIALAAGPRLATATFMAYLMAGAAGLPVFSGTPERGIGLAYMVGPTGGYYPAYANTDTNNGQTRADPSRWHDRRDGDDGQDADAKKAAHRVAPCWAWPWA